MITIPRGICSGEKYCIIFFVQFAEKPLCKMLEIKKFLPNANTRVLRGVFA